MVSNSLYLYSVHWKPTILWFSKTLYFVCQLSCLFSWKLSHCCKSNMFPVHFLLFETRTQVLRIKLIVSSRIMFQTWELKVVCGRIIGLLFQGMWWNGYWLARPFEFDLGEIKVVVFVCDAEYFTRAFDEGFRGSFFIMVWSMHSGIPIFYILSQSKQILGGRVTFNPLVWLLVCKRSLQNF